MFSRNLIYSGFIAFMVCFCGTLAQDQNQNQNKAPLNCSAAVGMKLNASVFGTWYKVANYPADINSGCIQVNIKLLPDNSTINVNVSYSLAPNLQLQNHEKHTNLSLNANSASGFNVTFVKPQESQTQPQVYIKFLNEYKTPTNVSWIAACGYSNYSNPNSSYNLILSRNRVSDLNLEAAYIELAKNYSDFKAGNYSIVPQTGCKASSATKTVPWLAASIALLYAILRAF